MSVVDAIYRVKEVTQQADTESEVRVESALMFKRAKNARDLCEGMRALGLNVVARGGALGELEGYLRECGDGLGRLHRAMTVVNQIVEKMGPSVFQKQVCPNSMNFIQSLKTTSRVLTNYPFLLQQQ